MLDLVTCKFDKNPIKNERSSVEPIRILHGREVQTENSVPSQYLASRGCYVPRVLHTFRFRLFYCKSSIHYHTK